VGLRDGLDTEARGKNLFASAGYRIPVVQSVLHTILTELLGLSVFRF
jgi:hypothetical protein